MKTINKVACMLSAVLFAVLITSCSEFMLIPISVDYPFDQNSKASPSTYKINITEGLLEVEKIFNNKLIPVTNKLFKELDITDAEIEIHPKFIMDDILDLISGKTFEKEVKYRIPTTDELLEVNIKYSICDFEESDFNDVEEKTSTFMTIENILTFCALSNSEKEAEIERCGTNADETCIHLAVHQENESMKIKMAEQKDLKKYKKYLNKVYSATLNEIAFTINSALNRTAGNNSFRMKTELYVQAIDPFKADGVTPCGEGDDLKQCIYLGVNEEGVPENYFTATMSDSSATDGTDSEKNKYLIGALQTDDDTYSANQVMSLFYTYEGKDVLQHAIKHLDFQLGIKSYYVFYPQALKPEGTLEATIKAKILFNVEPFN